jgi:pimeloyl-ACP methyl ester carboxylesterase
MSTRWRTKRRPSTPPSPRGWRRDEAFHLVGHSFGGASRCTWRATRRERLLSLTLFEPVAFHLLPASIRPTSRSLGVVARINACAEDRDATRVFIDYWNRAGAFDAAPAGAQDKMIAQIAKVRLDFEALLGERPRLAELSMVTMPALVMAGERSPASTRLLAEQLAAALPNATGLLPAAATWDRSPTATRQPAHRRLPRPGARRRHRRLTKPKQV